MNKKIIYYKDIFSDEFLNYFDDYKEAVGNIKLNKNELSIDLNEIAKVINVKIKSFDQNYHSGQYDSEKREIYINTTESPQRQRFTIAHELGHCVLNHDGISDRLIDSSDYSFTDSIRERAANRFATLLLMPKELLAMAIEQYQGEEQMSDHELENSSADKLIEKLAKKLNVSKQTMKYRLMNLGVIEG